MSTADNKAATAGSAVGKKSAGALSLLILAAIFLGVVLLSQMLFRGARLDLTSARQYTLNEGTKSILKKIPEPINMYFFFTQKSTAGLPQYQAYATRVKELLEEMSERSNGKIKLTVIDPQPFSEEEERASGYGLQQVPFGGGNQMTFGLAATSATGQQATVPFFQVEKEGFLEYDVAKMIQSLINDKKVVIGVMSNLPMVGGFDPATRQNSQPWVIYSQLSERFEMRQLGMDIKSVDSEIKLLMLVHPKSASDGPQGPQAGISDETLYAIDQFVVKGGRLMVFVDPNATQDQSGNDPNNPSSAMFANKSSDLPKLFKAWGVTYDPAQLVADRQLGVPVQVDQTRQPVKHPAIIGLTAENMNQKDIASADLESINFDGVGSFSVDPKGSLKLEPLMQSSSDAMQVATEQVKFMQDPNDLLKNFTPAKEPFTLVGNLTGKFKSAFPEKATEVGYIAESKEANTVFLAADTDMLSNRVWVQVQAFMNQQIANAFANNGDFIVNTVDKLSGDNDLISIRSRGKLKTSFTTVDKMRNDADATLRATEQSLQDELAETERKLSELQQNKRILSPEQQKELQNFQTKRNDVRKKLRDVRRSLDTEIEGLGRWVKFWGTFFAPIMVVLFAVFYFRRRVALRRSVARA
jgi:ABC-type uncharacterized transport system involved in gliding motility auxiliary subunit